jgi:hypothetical protein
MSRFGVVMLLALLLPCCAQSNGSPQGWDDMHVRIVAGPHEKNFADEYHLKITLPIPEKEFVALVDRLHLLHGSCGERGTERQIPPPKWSDKINMSAVQSCIQIYGKKDVAHRIGKMYRAYINGEHMVIYIENAFAYTGP